MDELTEQVLYQQQNVARQKKLNAMLADAKNYQGILIRKCESLKAELKKENADVIKLEGKTFPALVYSVLGTLDKHMEKEKREALAAKLKYEQTLKDLKEIENRIDRLTAERSAYTGCQEKYEELFAIKRQALLNQNNRDADRILELEKKIGAAKICLQEIDEATNAGRIAIEALRLALEKLESAENYGLWDMGGGGVITGAVKHLRIDEASSFIAEAQEELERFKSELCDIEPRIDISTTLFIVDIFFDNTITDFMVQSRIHKTQDSIEQAIRKIKQAIHKLCLNESEKKEELDSLYDNLKRLITYG